MKSFRLALVAATLAALPVAAQAYDDKPSKPPVGGGGGGGGQPTPVPAPAALGLFALGVAGLAVARRRR